MSTSRLTKLSEPFKKITRGGRLETYVTCRCDCGTVKDISVRSMKQGTISCGCYQKEINSSIKKVHGLVESPEYRNWRSLKKRCTCEKYEKFYNYGGRGITVCDRWLNSFENFYADMGPRPSPKHSIDRIDNDGNYEPGNCRWATAKEQHRNKRSNVFIEFGGKSQTLGAWSLELDINEKTLYSRLHQCKWSVEEAFTKPVRRSQ